MENNHNRRKQF
uniref:Uncharacterized protein n=1 Tax=Rhizophora mucronata TaxID=61149 RepID=A0A2P2QB34_RHIMU